jgi:hypothetical protein
MSFTLFLKQLKKLKFIQIRDHILHPFLNSDLPLKTLYPDSTYQVDNI